MLQTRPEYIAKVCINNIINKARICSEKNCISDVIDYIAKVSNRSYADLFLLLVIKKWTNMAVPCGAQIQSRKVFFCRLNTEWTTKQGLGVKMRTHFVHFQATFVFCSPLIPCIVCVHVCAFVILVASEHNEKDAVIFWFCMVPGWNKLLLYLRHRFSHTWWSLDLFTYA